MSVAAMISEHPDVQGHLNEPLAKAVRHLMFCSAICASCADACLAEEGDMKQCIRTCLDCSDICAAVTRVALRRTGGNETLIRDALGLAIQACETCAQECRKHDSDHCQRCAEMCRETAEDCRQVSL